MNIVLDVSAYQSAAQLDALLTNGPDTIVGVYIKLTQGTGYLSDAALNQVAVCKKHATPYGFYHFLTDDDCTAQAEWFADNEKNPGYRGAPLRMMLDAESPYDKGIPGIEHFAQSLGAEPIVYANYSDTLSYGYTRLGLPLWIAAYGAYSETYAKGLTDRFGALLWQYADRYTGLSQDASAVLGDFETLRAA